MSEYFIYYTESNAVCFIIFAILLTHNLTRKDRQEKQIKYDGALIAFMAYFASDCLWAAVDSGILPKTRFSVVGTNFLNFVLMSAISFAWLRYVMAVEKVRNRERRINKIAVVFPFAVSALTLIVLFFVSPEVLINEEFKMLPTFNVIFLFVPCVYIIAVLIYTIRRAASEENRIEKRRHLYVGLFPLIVIAGGLIEMVLLPTTPVFCFACTFLMLVFHIQSIDQQISTDPLTQLNNRGQLNQYVFQKTNLHKEGHRTYVFMMDINNFKSINDVYGHAEGDRALVIVANALRRAVGKYNLPMFLGRYGGDEFILIFHCETENGAKEMANEIREQLDLCCKEENTPYTVTLGIGFDKLRPVGDTFEECLYRADCLMYDDKERVKRAKGAA